MIALAAFQFVQFRRSRFWLAPMLGYLLYLGLFYLVIAQHAPASYGRGAIAVLLLGVGLGWALCASQPPALWQLTVVAAGGRDRAQLSRLLLSVAMLVPLAALSVPVAAAGHLSESGSAARLTGALVLYLICGTAGCSLGLAGARRLPAGAVRPVLALLGVLLLAILG